MYQRWSILCPPSTGSINLNCKGPLTENYVLQQLKGQFEVEPRYFSDKNGEIDFVIQYGTEIIPVETKGGEDKSAPSFKRYIAKNPAKPKNFYNFPDSSESSGESGVSYELEES